MTLVRDEPYQEIHTGVVVPPLEVDSICIWDTCDTFVNDIGGGMRI